MRRKQWGIAIAAVVVAVSAVGCSSGRGGSPDAAWSASGMPSSTSTASSTATKPLASYLLTDQDVPAGFVRQNLPAGASAGLSSLGELTKGVKVSPASCQPDPSKLPASGRSDAVKRVAYVNLDASSAIGSSVAPRSPATSGSIADSRKFNLGKCSKLKLKSTTKDTDGKKFLRRAR